MTKEEIDELLPDEIDRDNKLVELVDIYYCEQAERQDFDKMGEAASDWMREKAIEVISQLTKGIDEWISVKDLDAPYPEIGKAVMVHLASGYISIGYRKVEQNGIAWQIFGDIIDKPNTDMLTHWMHLPPIPNK